MPGENAMAASADNTILRSEDGVIVDAAGTRWSLRGGQVVVNGIVDQTSRDVLVLAYEHGRIWQENAARLWWSKSSPGDSWSPPYGTPVSPLVGVASPDNTVVVGAVLSGIAKPGVTDANGDRYTITADHRVAVNGTVDPTTARVIALAYENGRVYQENADRRWWSKGSAAEAWAPAYGTRHSPIPPGSTPPTVTYFSGSTVDYTDTVAPPEYAVLAVDDGDRPVTFTYHGRNVAAGVIQNLEGTLALDVEGLLTNSGTILTRPSIGNSFTTIDIAAGAMFRNTGQIILQRGQVGALTASLHVIGDGTFRNDGQIRITGGSSDDIAMHGSFINTGSIAIDDAFGTHHSLVTTGNIRNAGTIENHNQTLIQFGQSGPPGSGPTYAFFLNTGTIEGLYDVSHMTIAAGAFVHAADAYTVHDYHGTLVNEGRILATGAASTIEIAAPLQQRAGGRVDIENGGTVQLDARSDGGIIHITSGMLAFGGDRIAFHGPAGASGFHVPVSLDGDRAAFNFARTDIAAEFRPAAYGGDLLVRLAGSLAPEQIADIKLLGGYHASQFHVSGSEVLFTRAD